MVLELDTNVSGSCIIKLLFYCIYKIIVEPNNKLHLSHCSQTTAKWVAQSPPSMMVLGWMPKSDGPGPFCSEFAFSPGICVHQVSFPKSQNKQRMSVEDYTAPTVFYY